MLPVSLPLTDSESENHYKLAHLFPAVFEETLALMSEYINSKRFFKRISPQLKKKTSYGLGLGLGLGLTLENKTKQNKAKQKKQKKTRVETGYSTRSCV